uniref:pre-mRNA-processing factor 39 isoform X2 n=1 Tax=Myxine glutinosa TaxID=7769 RepID=UPI00358E2AC5
MADGLGPFVTERVNSNPCGNMESLERNDASRCENNVQPLEESVKSSTVPENVPGKPDEPAVEIANGATDLASVDQHSSLELPQSSYLKGDSPMEISATGDFTGFTADNYKGVEETAGNELLCLPPEFEKYWKAVEENPQDFTGWTYLLQYVEQENNLWASRKAFDEFFMRYPYCYGYWKKYADFERKFGNVEHAEEVFRRGLQAIPLSVDLWIHYINFEMEILELDNPDTAIKLKSLFELAMAAAGTDFRSDKLWDMYINWERDRGQLRDVTTIFDVLLGVPTQLYSHHFDKFKEHVRNNLPKDIMSTDDFLALRAEVVSGEKSVNTAGEELDPPGGDKPPGTVPVVENEEDLETEKLRERIIAARQEVHMLNEQEVSKRWNFEEGVKRPYFHVKPLERAQLKNWKDYLDFEIENGTHERVVVLFERCMIACALYEEFWIKYAKYMENHNVEGVQNVFRRACMIHLPRKSNLHLLWAAFEEEQGNFDEARRVLRDFEMMVPGLVMVRLRRVSLERRQSDLASAEQLLRDALSAACTPEVVTFYAVKLSRWLLKAAGDRDRARTVLLEAIEKDKANSKLYLNLLELEFCADLKENEENVLNCFEQALTSDLSVDLKITFSQRKVEFLEDFGSDMKTLLMAYDEHQQLLKQHMACRKRSAENGDTLRGDELDEKRSRVDDVSVPAMSSAVGMVSATAAPPMIPTLPTPTTDTQATQAYAYNWYQPYNYQSYQGTYPGYTNPWGYGPYYPPT